MCLVIFLLLELYIPPITKGFHFCHRLEYLPFFEVHCILNLPQQQLRREHIFFLLPDIAKNSDEPTLLESIRHTSSGKHLMPRHILHMTRIYQDDLKILFQNIEYRLPVNSRAFHGHVRNTFLFAPFS